MAHSILKYGSFIRGNSDKYSDKDILVVADTYNELNQLKSNYINLGWSVSAYTYDKLQYLAENGFLFVKHLIEEGQIVEDKNWRLKNILEKFQEKLDYQLEMAKASIFLNFVEKLPNNAISYSWLCDNLYITFRNYLIYKSALKNEFNFSYISLVNKLVSDDEISLKEANILNQLRVLKSCYRNDFQDIIPSKEYVDSVISILNNIGLKIEITFSDKSLLFETNAFNKIDSSYKKLRYLELILKNINIEDEYLNKCIANPQMYASNRGIEKLHKKVLQKIKTSHNSSLAKWRIQH